MKQLFKLVNQYAPLKYKAFLTLAVYSLSLIHISEPTRH